MVLRLNSPSHAAGPAHQGLTPRFAIHLESPKQDKIFLQFRFTVLKKYEFFFNLSVVMKNANRALLLSRSLTWEGELLCPPASLLHWYMCTDSKAWIDHLGTNYWAGDWNRYISWFLDTLWYSGQWYCSKPLTDKVSPRKRRAEKGKHWYFPDFCVNA